MLTLEETRWSLNAFKIYSFLNIFPIQVDVKNGKIGRQSNPTKVFIWKILFGISILHLLYVFGRIVQSTILEPEKLFRWDHFILHFACILAAAVFYYTGFCLFVKNPKENVMIFNHLFVQREDPVQKMIDQEQALQIQKKVESEHGNGNQNQGKETMRKSSAQKSNGRGGNQNEVIENQPNSDSETRPRPRPLLTWPPQYSLDELLAKLCPLATAFTAGCAVIFLVADPTRPQLLYSSLPPEWQNPSSFVALLPLETLWIAVYTFNSGLAIATQVLFFGKCQLQFKRMSLQLGNLEDKFQNRSLENGGRSLEREIWILRQILAEMRELVVLIELFNRCFPFCIFAWKICSLSISILNYFFLIRHVQDFPVLGLFMGYMAAIITLTYTIMYEHAFSIPGKMDDLKNEFLLTAQKTTSNPNVNKNLKAEMEREIKRFQSTGVKVGSFQTMERESTPNFINFVVDQVVSLLVTFPA